MPSPVDLPAMLLGAETWMETLLFDQPAALALLERCDGFCAAFGNAERFRNPLFVFLFGLPVKE